MARPRVSVADRSRIFDVRSFWESASNLRLTLAVQLSRNGDPMAIGVNIPLVDRTEINGATDVVPGTHKLSPLLGYGGRQPNRPENEPDYNKLLIQVLKLITLICILTLH